MMLPTHVIFGLLLVTPAVLLFDLPASVLYGAVIGSILPDIDLLFGVHRKTVHFPVYSLGISVGAIILVILYPITELFILCGVILGFTFHSASDVFGSGLEVHPWERTSDKAVYNHYTDSWEEPLHYLSYDGSPTDLFALLSGSGMIWIIWVNQNYIPYIREILLISIGIGVSYTVSRRLLPKIDIWLFDNVVWMRPFLRLIRDENRTVSREESVSQSEDNQ